MALTIGKLLLGSDITHSRSKTKSLLISALLASTSTAIAAPTVSNNTISWPDDGWYQVEEISSNDIVCQGGRQCTVTDGAYRVIRFNRDGDTRFEVSVEGSLERRLDNESFQDTLSITGNTISWSVDGWYQVQDATGQISYCNGEDSCTVPGPALYIVINHSLGLRTRINVPNNQELVTGVTVVGQTIRWPDNGWYQVQRSSDYVSLCEGGLSCVVPNGNYIVINHDTGERFKNIVVGNDNDAEDNSNADDQDNAQTDTPTDASTGALTPLPGRQDEPVAITHVFNTIEEVSLVQDPNPRLPRDTSQDISLDDFLNNPIPPITTAPGDINVSANSPPYFKNLMDVTGFAGEEIRVLLQPVDDDGGVAGLFTESRPSGSRVVDNFDTTKSFVWYPFQKDVGIHDFSATAIDPEEPQYRTKRTVRIQVLLPDDTSGIRNLAPSINRVRPHTVRVGDPVSIQVKVNDPNGTIPTLEVLNLPDGATFEPHYQEPDFSVIRFLPDRAGEVVFDLLARDIDDPNSTAQIAVSINVVEPQSTHRPGSRLRDLAEMRDLQIGYASLQHFYNRPDGALYADVAAEEFNIVTTENSLKWVFVNPLPGRYRWAAVDNLVNFAKANNMVLHGHTLVWYTALPGWVRETPIDEREGHMKEFIDRILERYADDIEVWDVVNEAFEDDGRYRNSVWFEAMGESHIDIAFEHARAAAPDAILLYNDYDVSWFGPKANAMFTMLEEQLERGTPIDGVGFQMHLDADFDLYDQVEVNFQRAADLGLDVYITELDVSMVSGSTEEDQAEVYGRVLDICLRQSRCKAFQLWGFTDQYSWRVERNPLILDEQYNPKPAYLELQRRLSE